jgi:hypothetical protein
MEKGVCESEHLQRVQLVLSGASTIVPDIHLSVFCHVVMLWAHDWLDQGQRHLSVGCPDHWPWCGLAWELCPVLANDCENQSDPLAHVSNLRQRIGERSWEGIRGREKLLCGNIGPGRLWLPHHEQYWNFVFETDRFAYVTQAGLELTMPQPLPPEYWDYKYAPIHLAKYYSFEQWAGCSFLCEISVLVLRTFLLGFLLIVWRYNKHLISCEKKKSDANQQCVSSTAFTDNF